MDIEHGVVKRHRIQSRYVPHQSLFPLSKNKRIVEYKANPDKGAAGGDFKGRAEVLAGMAQADAQTAIQALNGQQLGGRPLRVNEAQERPQRPRQGGGPFRR